MGYNMKITKYNKYRNISGSKLKALRKNAKMSQQDLAEKLQLEGIDLTSKEISKIETNKRLVQDFELFLQKSLKYLLMNLILKINKNYRKYEKFYKNTVLFSGFSV